MSAYDLSGLEQAAAEAGLPGLAARVVPHDRRRGRWFGWTADELLVSERVLERLRPDEGAVLVVHAIVTERLLAVARRRAWAWVAALALLAALATVWRPDGWLVHALAFLALLLPLPAVMARARQRADDQTVALLGDAERLVRALNVIHQDEVRVGGLRLPAHPGVHERAERLVRLHQLRLPPELRQGCAAPDGSHAGPVDRA